jgi:hypothetical protein
MLVRTIIGIVIIISLALLLIETYCTGSKRCKDSIHFMSGFWKADNDWCDKAGVDNVCVTIDVNHDMKTGSMYIIIQDKDSNLLENDYYDFKINASPTEKIRRHSSRNIEYTIVFQDDQSPVQNMIPTKCKLRTNLSSGVLAIHDGNTVFLELFKDNITTSYMTTKDSDHSESLVKKIKNKFSGVKERYLIRQPRTDPPSDVEQPTSAPSDNSPEQSFREFETIVAPHDQSEGEML